MKNAKTFLFTDSLLAESVFCKRFLKVESFYKGLLNSFPIFESCPVL